MPTINSTADVERRHWEDARYWNTDLWLDEREPTDAELAADMAWCAANPERERFVSLWHGIAISSAAVTSWALFVAGRTPVSIC